uniref:Uncharacterized protein n=1 Tax=Globodera rostochiensis TaxID=31243 RepID=A0A914I0R5_GLORO
MRITIRFCLTFAYLELWANSNHIDDAKLGVESQKFSNMCEHFIVVTCTASNYRIDNFANFVSKRLGPELAQIIENPLEKWINLAISVLVAFL